MDIEEKYQCHICMEMANKPIVTPCGHLFWYLKNYSVGHASIIGCDPIKSI